MKLPVIPVKRRREMELYEIVDKLEKETKKALARQRITPNKAIEVLKIIILAMFFELDSYAVSVNKRYELRKFLRIEGEVKLRSVYYSCQNLNQISS